MIVLPPLIHNLRPFISVLHLPYVITMSPVSILKPLFIFTVFFPRKIERF